MAPSVPKKGKVHLPENEEVAAVLREKHRSMKDQLGELTEHQNRTLSTAYRNVCSAKDPIRTLDDLRRIKGVGEWVIHIMKDSFPESSLDLSSPKSNTSGEKGKKRKQTKPYVPQKNSAAYAIVITLYREMIKGKDVMLKKELIDAAEASGLSQFAIGANNYKAQPGSSQKDFYTGWSCMKTLLSNEVVHKWSNPAKYKLTDKGKETARDCLARSGLDDPAGPPKTTSHSEKVILSDSDSDEPYKGNNPLIGSEHSTQRSGLPKLKALSPSSLNANKERTTNFGKPASSCSNSPFSSQGVSGQQLDSLLAMPLRRSDENFLEAYEVVLILDDREKLGPHDKRKVAANISSQFRLSVEIRHLPVGDCIWIARHRGFGTEYVLDFIIERKNVEDLIGSIRDNRYSDQKLRLKLLHH
ncbi:hypothetical protein BRADI_2g60640v3 [Brachypodium distachyon]|uniref:Crossover junction endonuclease MUS81 n=1 Tax=Brachypodium distachyon TaxID=15368 RepID=A0A0Q3J0N6_BRADI|nr:hypothetical protein BRADI_2g60640v3 [Brachypodium distachyon]